MDKQESHEDLVKYVDKIERNLSERIKETDKKVDVLREEVSDQRTEHREMDVYVKDLYKRFDDLTAQMQLIVMKLDSYIVTLTTIQTETKNTSMVQKRGKDLIFEIIKWIVLLGLGMLLTTQNAV